jgi:peptidoglycan hydrolase CwlO-like protein
LKQGLSEVQHKVEKIDNTKENQTKLEEDNKKLITKFKVVKKEMAETKEIIHLYEGLLDKLTE